ncbi:MAG: TauD/TfdA family dioxygenase [Hyphomicrobiaceae bacterium]|nr:TauD/TfdA family dioxygenase [Hyphomicrobiaceae bacterium]
MRNTRLDIRPTNGALGAEVHGVDLRERLDEAVVGEMREALGEHGVLFFRDQMLTPDQQVAFARRFAPINVNRFFKASPEHPEIAEVRKEPEQTRNIGGNWHTDHSYDQIPALGSVLLAREVPPRGGDTIFACMAKAFATLSPGLQRTLEGLRAVHSSRHVFGRVQYGQEMNGRIGNPEAANQDAVHPVVIRHPISGRKILFVNPGFTTHFEGWTEAESKPLLETVYAHARRPDFQTRFQWREGSIAFWDNRATWHYAVNDYQGERRLMHRVTLEGVPLQ